MKMKKCNYAKKIGLKINNKNLVKIYIQLSILQLRSL